MSFEIWLAFLAASTVLILIPGPTVMMLIGYGLSRGHGVALYAMPGVALGNAVAISGAFLGLGALLATSALAFTIVKWVGAAYLIWLGIGMWRARPDRLELGTPDTRQGLAVFGHAFAVTALNPKSIGFFMAFLPQFITVEAPLLPQYLILGATFVGVSAIFDSAYALAAGTACDLFRTLTFRLVANRVGGTALIGAGVAMATLKRAN